VSGPPRESARLRALRALSTSLEVEAAERLVEKARFALACSTARLEAMRARLLRLGAAIRGPGGAP
jgi:hypothetical protein